MKNIVLTSIFIIASIASDCQCGLPEDLIHNCSFEFQGSSQPNIQPGQDPCLLFLVSLNNDNYVSEWRSRCKSPNNCAAKAVHSPDYFNDNSTAHTEMQTPFGNKFIGMGDYELIQQKFHNSLKLEEGVNYSLSLQISLVTETCGSLPLTSNWNGSNLNVYLSKNKIKYKSETNCNHAGACGYVACDSKFRTHEDGLFQNIHKLTEFNNLNWTNYPQNNWHKLSFNFTATNDMESFDWFNLELDNDQGNCCKNYILIDEVSLLPSCLTGCEMTCNRVDGPMSPLITNYQVGLNDGFRISNLDNITNMNLEISTILGQPIFTHSIDCDNGILQDFVWTGIDNNGHELPIANYPFKLTYTNDCGFQCEIVGVAQKMTNTNFSSNYYYCGSSESLLEESCCASSPDISVNNFLLTEDNNHEIHAYRNLYFSQNSSGVEISQNVNQTYKAGSKISLLPGFKTNMGSSLKFRISQCN